MPKYLPLLGAALATAITATAFTAPVRADGLYLGGGAYRADSDVGDDTVPGGFVGYTFVDSNFLMLSAEIGYYDLGNSGNRKEKVDASAITAGGVLALPLGPMFELYAKAGVASADIKKDSPGNSDSSTDEKAYYGIGASLDLLDTIDIYIEYLVFDTNINSELAGVGLKLSF
jgi:opacity protein-like surface antigen